MKRFLLLLLTLLGSLNVFGQNYVILWNSITSKYEIQQVNTSTGVVTHVGYSSAMTSYYDLDQIYYDATNNQIVGLYQDTDLWKYNLSTNTDEVVNLGTDSYRCLIMGNNTSYVLFWNVNNNVYEVKELNLSSGALTFLGNTSTINGSTELTEVFYDETNNRLIGLWWGGDYLWTYNLGTNTDAKIDITGSDSYKSLAIANGHSYLIRWNTDIYEVYELNSTTGAITLLGNSSTTLVTSSYNINEVYYDVANNQLIALHQYNSIWKYNLSTNTDAVVSLGGADDYRDLAIYNTSTPTPVIDPLTLSESDDEIIKIYDMMGREVPVMETGKVMILVYKSGKAKKVFVTE